MTRRLGLVWPDPRPFVGRGDRPIRLLAASDEPDPTLEHASNRAKLGAVDAVLGCGDLEPDWLSFLGDAFQAPLIYVRGNHDSGGPWPAPRVLPEAANGVDDRSVPGVPILALSWPSYDGKRARHDQRAAWGQVLRLGLRPLMSARPGTIIISHVPPRGAGDTPDDPYHVGFDAYAFLAGRIRPRLWIHGHTNVAAKTTWRVQHGPTTVVNATGSVLVELTPTSIELRADEPNDGGPTNP